MKKFAYITFIVFWVAYGIYLILVTAALLQVADDAKYVHLSWPRLRGEFSDSISSYIVGIAEGAYDAEITLDHISEPHKFKSVSIDEEALRAKGCGIGMAYHHGTGEVTYFTRATFQLQAFHCLRIARDSYKP